MTAAHGFVSLEIRTCTRCGFDYPRGVGSRHQPTLCPPCRNLPAPPKPGAWDQTSPGYRLALTVTTLRLAVEQARAALRMGRADVALAVLEMHEADAPTVKTRRKR